MDKKFDTQFTVPATEFIKDDLANGIVPPSFNTQEELDNFLKETEHIPLRKIPRMPFRKLGDYVNEYSKIYDGVSKLSDRQKKRVQNIVHLHLRRGTIKLK